MSRFVPNTRIAVSLDDPITADSDVIYIKAGMDYGTQQRVKSAAFHTVSGKVGTVENEIEAGIDIGAANVALLVENVVDWSGPGFEGLPCNATNLQRIAADDPLLDKVLAEINRRNKSKEAGELPLSGSAGSNGSGATPPSEEPTMSISSSPSATIGPNTLSTPQTQTISPS